MLSVARRTAHPCVNVVIEFFGCNDAVAVGISASSQSLLQVSGEESVSHADAFE